MKSATMRRLRVPDAVHPQPPGIAPQIEMEIASNETIERAEASGFGLRFLSAHAVQQELQLSRLVVVPVKGFPVMRQAKPR